MPDIVPNLLRLSSEVKDVAELLESSLELILAATGTEAVAVAVRYTRVPRPAAPATA